MDKEAKDKMTENMEPGEIKPIISRTEVWFGKDSREIMESHTEMLKLHYRALACHCECLGMNAENAMAVCGNYTPPYNDAAYFSVMQKWGLTNEKGESII